MREYKNKFADIRADLIKKLESDNWESSFSLPYELKENFKLIGSGKIENGKKPVVVFFSQRHPFPGFGQMQLENLFICSPKNKRSNINLSEGKLFENVINEIETDLKFSGLSNFNTGKLISVYGKSLRMDSNWLDSKKRPILYSNKEDIDDYKSIEKNASSRLFFVIELLLPKYMTAACFFVRVYKAENSAACQICMTTLGPPYFKNEDLQSKLIKYRTEKEQNETLRIAYENTINSNTKLFKELRLQRHAGKSEIMFSNNPRIENIKKLDPLSLENSTFEYKNEYSKIINESIYWPGYHYYPLNWREGNSLTFTGDFFGRPEALSTIKTVVDQISRSILDSFEHAGYDVSNYKDKDGNYSINADKIDQLVVGEKINIKQNKPKDKGESKNKDNSGGNK